MKRITHKNFTLIELILVIGIVAIMAAAMIPIVAGARSKAIAAKMLIFADRVKGGAIECHSDLGYYCREAIGGGEVDDHSLTFPVNENWKGPYISDYFSYDDNPYGGPVILLDRMPADFDLDGDSTVDKAVFAFGNVLTYFYIPEITAKVVNDSYDSGVPGDWKANGRVIYRFEGRLKRLDIYLIGGS